MNSRFSEFTSSMNPSDSALFSAIFKVNSEINKEENVDRRSALPKVTVPAMAYIPLQFLNNITEIEDGFSKGTIFPELNKPFNEGEVR